MDTLSFIAAVIGHLAWPVTAIIMILIIRQPLLALFPYLRRLRFQGIELDFSRQVQALAMEARGELPSVRGVLDADGRLRENWVELAQFSPRALVLEAWLQLEKAAVEAARRHGLTLRSADLRSPLVLGQALEEGGILEGNTPAIYHQLRNLRNAAAHASDLAFTPDSALEYADLATRLTEYLRKS